MAAPTKPGIDYSYTGFAQGLGSGLFPGTQLDNDLVELADAISETIDFTSAVIRDDGRLQNGVVTKASLDATLLLGVAPPRPWAAGQDYEVDETVTINNSIFICVAAHLSANFPSERGAGFWGLIAEFTVPAAIGDGTVTEVKHAAGGVSTRALADLAVTGPKIGPAAVTNDKLAVSTALSLMPIGAELDFAGALAPFGWAFEFGQAVSRTTYSALFNVLCPGLVVTTANASPVLTGVTTDMRNLGLEGAPVEGTNIPPGAAVVSVTVNTITISLNATGAATGVVARILPWGVGDGATTFNLPDARDRASIGRGNMGGAAAGRVSGVGLGNPQVDTTRLGFAGGVDRHAITVGQLGSHSHVAATTITGVGDHTHAVALSQAGYGTPGGSTPFWVPGSSVNVTPGGAHTHLATTTVSPNAGGEAHPNVQPSRVTNKIIFTGVV